MMQKKPLGFADTAQEAVVLEEQDLVPAFLFCRPSDVKLGSGGV